MKQDKKSPEKQGVNWSIIKHYFFCCIPFFSNEFLKSLTFWDWLPLIISIASLIASIAAYCKH